MGNQVCCPRGRRNPEDAYRTPISNSNGAPSAKTQNLSVVTPVSHINEREQDENDDDPSSHPTTAPLFKEKSRPDLVRYSAMKRPISCVEHMNTPSSGRGVAGVLHKKYSSCSTIYIDDSTVSQPNLKNSIKAVALAIYYHIRKRPATDSTMDIFDERLHPLSREPVPDDYTVRDPEHRQIYRFIRTLFSAAQLTAECAIVTLVYLERLLIYAEITLLPSNWRRITLGAILLASKVWDDQAVWNVDYCQILKDTTVEDMNELERVFLEQLQFNINVPSSVYAKYYFDLRALADASELGLPMEPLSREKALKLEATSHICEDKLRETTKQRLLRSNSLGGISSPRTNAILS